MIKYTLNGQLFEMEMNCLSCIFHIVHLSLACSFKMFLMAKSEFNFISGSKKITLFHSHDMIEYDVCNGNIRFIRQLFIKEIHSILMSATMVLHGVCGSGPRSPLAAKDLYHMM